MNKITVIINDYSESIKSYISYDSSDIDKILSLWDEEDERLKSLNVLDSFKGYDKWSELTPEHFRLLITRGLNTLIALSPQERTDTSNPVVATANFVILAFMICIEKLTGSRIEHFRINRFDALNVTFDFSASFEMDYSRPSSKVIENEPSFSIVFENPKDGV